ncbi:MAG: hypothetical protein GXP25_24580 [Planctomycetes bacterium]|nr:hypothetical protein [Planctomycetota bacterium]
MRAKQSLCLLMALTCIALCHCKEAEEALRDPCPRVRRQAILAMAASGQASADALAGMLRDKDRVVRRTAARVLLQLGKPAMPALLKATGNSDMVVRRMAVQAVAGMGAEAVPRLAKALKDEEPLVRQAAAVALARVRPGTEEILKLLETAAKDDDPTVQAAAQRGVDHFFDIAESVRLPKDNWAFCLDPKKEGKDKGWFKPDFDDKKWRRLTIETAWQNHGIQYIGTAWYRRIVDAPKFKNANRIVLRFEGVDECAWVWVNGQYAGEHDIGPKGWNIPFRLDVTNLIRQGRKNQITVRAMNTAAAGGIWRPVYLQVLRMRE